MDRLEEIRTRRMGLIDKLLYFVAGGYTTQDTLRSLCKDAAFELGDTEKEISRLTSENERLRETQTFIKERLRSMPIGNKVLENIRSQILVKLEDTTCG